MPAENGSVTPSAAAVATAASAALPPRRRTSMPTAVASASTLATAPPNPVAAGCFGGGPAWAEPGAPGTATRAAATADVVTRTRDRRNPDMSTSRGACLESYTGPGRPATRDACPGGTPASAQRGATDRRPRRAEEEDARQARGLEAVAGVAPQGGPLDDHRAGAVVADEEHRPAALVRVVPLDARARDAHGETVAVGVDRAATAAAGRTAAGGVGARAHGPVVADHGVEHDPRDTDAAQRAPVRADAALAGGAAERAADDVHRVVAALVEHADRGTAEVRARAVAAVAHETR